LHNIGVAPHLPTNKKGYRLWKGKEMKIGKIEAGTAEILKVRAW
jgi:hypothetical protein